MNPKFLFYFLFLIFCSHGITGQAPVNRNIRLCLSFPPNVSEDPIYTKISFQNNHFFIPLKDTCVSIILKKARNYQIIIEAREYTTTIIPIKDDTLTDNKKLNISIIPKNKLLQEVIVRPDNRIHFRGDTLIIDVDSIKVKPHGNTTDLLKKLPSVTVGSWGNVEIMGKSVSTITINGRQIFGGNTKAILETIKADMIENLEITQSRTGQNSIDLNLKLKKGRDNGWFGEMTLGGGNEDTQKGETRMNRISPKHFINFFLNQNSTSEKVLTSNSSQHIQSMVRYNDMDGVYSLTDNQINFLFPSKDNKSSVNVPTLDKTKGINTSLSGGLNYTRTNKNSEWYSFILGDVESQKLTETTNQLTVFSDRIQQKNITESDKKPTFSQLWAALYGNIKPSKYDIFKTFTLIQSQNNQQLTHIIANSSFTDTGLNTSNNDLIKNLDQSTSSLRLMEKVSWIHRYAKVGVVTSFYGAYDYNRNTLEKEYENNLFQNSIPKISNHHFLTRKTPENTVNIELAQSYPLTSKLLFEIKNKFLYESSNTSQSVLKYNEIGHFFKDTISALSLNKFGIKSLENETHASIFLKTNRFDLILGVDMWTWKTNRTILKDEYSVFKILPTFYWKWLFNHSRHLFIYMNQRQQIPDYMQLFPLSDSSSIQQISSGNPNLVNNPTFHIGTSLLTSYNSVTIHPSISYQQYDNISSINSIIDKNSSISQNYVQQGQIQRIIGGLRVYRLPRVTISWAVSSSFIIDKYTTFWEGNSTLTSNFNGNLLSGLKWNPNSQASFSLDVRTSISGLFQQQKTIVRNDIILTGEYELSQKTYLDVNFELFLNRSTNNKSYNYPILDLVFSQYLFKNNALKLGIQAKNIFDIRQIFDSYSSSNSQVEFLFNRMPRFIMFTGTFYIERWKK
jgi:hypothetical protein